MVSSRPAYESTIELNDMFSFFSAGSLSCPSLDSSARRLTRTAIVRGKGREIGDLLWFRPQIPHQYPCCPTWSTYTTTTSSTQISVTLPSHFSFVSRPSARSLGLVSGVSMVKKASCSVPRPITVAYFGMCVALIFSLESYCISSTMWPCDQVPRFCWRAAYVHRR